MASHVAKKERAFCGAIARRLRACPRSSIGVLGVVVCLFLLPVLAIGGMTLGADVVHGVGTRGTNTLIYNGLKAGRGLVCLVIFNDKGGEAIERITVSDEPDMTLDGTPSRN